MYAYPIVLRSTLICAHCRLASPLNNLPYGNGASWNLSLVCLPGTRLTLLEDIWTWIQTANHTKSAEIFLLSDLAGTGKTAIAHTVARSCDEAGLLASSFFFDRNVPERSGPQGLFSTIAYDIAVLTHDISEYVSGVLKRHRNDTTSSPSRQFDQLILNPSHLHRFDKPMVIVMDALD